MSLQESISPGYFVPYCTVHLSTNPPPLLSSSSTAAAAAAGPVGSFTHAAFRRPSACVVVVEDVHFNVSCAILYRVPNGWDLWYSVSPGFLQLLCLTTPPQDLSCASSSSYVFSVESNQTLTCLSSQMREVTPTTTMTISSSCSFRYTLGIGYSNGTIDLYERTNSSFVRFLTIPGGHTCAVFGIWELNTQQLMTCGKDDGQVRFWTTSFLHGDSQLRGLPDRCFHPFRWSVGLLHNSSRDVGDPCSSKQQQQQHQWRSPALITAARCVVVPGSGLDDVQLLVGSANGELRAWRIGVDIQCVAQLHILDKPRIIGICEFGRDRKSVV